VKYKKIRQYSIFIAKIRLFVEDAVY